MSAGPSPALDKSPRRGFPRYPVKVPIDVIALRSGVPQSLPGRCTDLSEGGLGAMVAGDLSPGQQVALELRLPNVALPVRARAQVRYQGPARCGFEFVDLAMEERAMIRYWMYKLTLEAASAGITKGDTSQTEAQSAKTQSTLPPEAEIEGTHSAPAQSSPAQSSAEAGRTDAVNTIPAAWQELDKAPSEQRTVSNKPRRTWTRRRILGCVLGFLLCSLLLAAVGWWQWQRSWRELERETTAQSALVQVPPEAMAARIISKVEPVYPEEARRAGIQGLVVFDVLIAADGTVSRVSPVSGDEMLSKSAAEAVRQWKFEPYRLSGHAREVETAISVEFRLN